MLTTYFLGGLIDFKKCQTRIDASKSDGEKLPDGINYIISVDADLIKSPKDVKKAFSSKGYPKCKVNDSGTIIWIAKDTTEHKFQFQEIEQNLTNSTTIVGFKQPLYNFLNQSMSKSPGRARIESSSTIIFKEEPLDSKDRIYPSLSISKLLKHSKIGKIQFRNQTLIDTNNCGDKTMIDVMSGVSEFRQLISNARPFIKSINGFKVITKDTTISVKIHGGFKMEWFPEYDEKPEQDIVPLMFDCLSEIIDKFSSLDF